MNENEKDYVIQEKLKYISSNRGTGRSYRILNEIIDAFFNNPIGTKIEIFDHYAGNNAKHIMLQNFKRRMSVEHPNVEYEIINDCVVRKSKTKRELILEELKSI